MRIFDDGGKHTNLWFEFEPGLFWCGDDEADARDCQRTVPRLGQTEENLRNMLTITEVKGEA